MSNELPVYNGIPALTPHGTTTSMRDRLAYTIAMRITVEDGLFVGGFFNAADAILAAFTVTERNQSND
jgi:hypothetical protein